jgi:hypothetical protein
MSQEKIYSDLDYQKTSEVTNMLHESKDWLILRSDSKGVLHIHLNKAWESLHLIPLFLYADNDLYKEVVTIVNKYKKQNK